MADDVVFLGMPRHYEATAGAFKGLYWHACRPGTGRRLAVAEFQASLLAFGFNNLWAQAVNAVAEHGVTHFAMLHSDIEPEPWWLDSLLDEMERTGADVLSAVAPIKAPDGVTSTALGDPADEWAPARRLTMHEVHRLPETFGAADCGEPDKPLLVNTGCWVARRGSWWPDVCFTVRDRMTRGADGRLAPLVIPEDWDFARFCWRRGLKVLATRKVRLRHWGPVAFDNSHPWGQYERDPHFPAPASA